MAVCVAVAYMVLYMECSAGHVQAHMECSAGHVQAHMECSAGHVQAHMECSAGHVHAHIRTIVYVYTSIIMQLFVYPLDRVHISCVPYVQYRKTVVECMSVLNIVSWYISRRAGDCTRADPRQTPDAPLFTRLVCLRACLRGRLLLLPLHLHRAAQPESQHHVNDLHQANDNRHASHGIHFG